jgi:transmembrane protein 17
MLRRPPELPRSVNNRLNRLATSVFTSNDTPDLKQGNTFHSKQARIEIDYSSSLPLQMLLYFNVCFFPCWLFSLTFVLPVLSLITGQNYHVILMVFAFIFKAIIECVRLYLGYAGNLAERMPELTAFCLLTIIFQIPLSIFLLVYPLIATIGIQLSLVFAVEIIYLTFLLIEAGFGIYAVRIMVTAQSSRFHYRQFEENLSANDSASPSG